MGRDMEVDRHISNVVAAMLLDPRNEGHGMVSEAEANFGSHAFDTHFRHIPLENLLGVLRNYANDYEKGHGGIKDFLGCVDEYVAMPCSSLHQRMIQAARRALNEYNDAGKNDG